MGNCKSNARVVLLILVGVLAWSGCTGSFSLFKKKDKGVLVQMDGYRVQVMTTSSKLEADNEVAGLMEWWAAEEGVELPVEIVWQQPYYRVRVGNYVEDGEAESMRAALLGRYPEAFVVKDQVWVLSTSR